MQDTLKQSAASQMSIVMSIQLFLSGDLLTSAAFKISGGSQSKRFSQVLVCRSL